MADNTTLNPGAAGDVVSTDDIGGVKVQRVKIQTGADGSATDVADGSAAVPIRDGGNILSVDDGAGSLTVDGTVTAQDGGGSLSVDDNGGNLSVDDGGGSLTVDGTVAASEAKAEDAAHSSGDQGLLFLAVRKATATDLSAGATDGDYEPLEVDASGRLHVNPTGVIGSATTDAAVTTDATGTMHQFLRGIVTILGAVTASPVANSIGDRLKSIYTALTGTLNVTVTDAALQTTKYKSGTSYVASGVIKATAGWIFGLTVYNSKTSGQWVMLFNSASVPGNGTERDWEFYVPAQSSIDVGGDDLGDYYTTGICWSNSSTAMAKTLGSTDMSVTARYS